VAQLSDGSILVSAISPARSTADPAVPPKGLGEAALMACLGCHGADGMAMMEDMPNLAGEDRVSLEIQLKPFFSGERVHENISPVATDLTDEEITALRPSAAAHGGRSP
jgi:cytochrome c553